MVELELFDRGRRLEKAFRSRMVERHAKRTNRAKRAVGRNRRSAGQTGRFVFRGHNARLETGRHYGPRTFYPPSPVACLPILLP
jgi:hypothetical protein